MINHSVAVMIPAYNEENTIARIINDTNNIFKRYYKNYEIIIINDCSTDKTLEICNEQKKKIKNLKIYTNKVNMGKTKTILEGLDLTNADIISFIDADYQYDPQDLPKVIQKVIEGYDICSGKRKDRKDSLYRIFMSRLFNLFNRLMFSIKLEDVNCGLKAFKKNILNDINIEYLNAKWFIDTELLAKAYKKNMKITQVDINHFPREGGESKVFGIKLAIETIIYGIILKWRFIFNDK
jgi:glycosyltransferase involved in cell wall biosynthesis